MKYSTEPDAAPAAAMPMRALLAGAIVVAVATVVASIVLSVVLLNSGSSTGSSTGSMDMDPSRLPGPVRQAYAAAVSHGDLFVHLPCYCGCAALVPPHRSLRDCFLEDDGTYASHAESCLICTEIALAAVEAADAGMSHGATRALVDGRFAGRGPSTDTPLPPE